MQNVPRMRGIKDIAQIMKQQDPETKLTERAIRRLVITGAIPHVRNAGKKYLINLDVFYAWLNGEFETQQGAAHIKTAPIIRPINF